MTPDVNVLVAASRRDHPHHGVALAWLEGALANAGRGAAVALMPMVVASFLRLVTRRRKLATTIGISVNAAPSPALATAPSSQARAAA